MYYSIKCDDFKANVDYLKQLISKNTTITIRVNDNDYSKFLDLDLPVPNLQRFYDDYYIVMYIIDGYFNTKKNKEYLSDIKDKLAHSFNGEIAENPYYWAYDSNTKGFNVVINVDEKNDRIITNLYTLKQFTHLQFNDRSKIKKRLYKVNKERKNVFKLLGDDWYGSLFEMGRWAIYETKIDGTLCYAKSVQILEDLNKEFNNKYSNSDIKINAKSITDWTRDNYNPGKHSEGYYKYYYNKKRRKKDNRMLQKDFLNTLHKEKEIKTQNKILKAIKVILNDDDLKFNKSNLAKVAGISRPTLNKYESLFNCYL